jgi:3-hydroxyisobutyrate dehydrogenase-like beta-hydroxyacid dehydrogenase
VSDVTVVGLGLMGSALARVLVENGHSVTVWNRTEARAAPLQKMGAVVSADVASAVAASPITLVCVANYDVSNQILGGIGDAVGGKVLVQLSTGTPGEARAAEAWALGRGAEYVDGAIMNYPNTVGKPGSTIYASGAQSAYQNAEPLLHVLASALLYKGEQAGLAAAWDLVLLSEYYGMFLSFFHSVQICQAEGIPLEDYGAVLAQEGKGFFARLAGNIASGRHDDTQAKLETWANAIERIAQHAADAELDTGFPQLSLSIFQKALAAGYGNQEVSALINVLGGPKA